MPRSRKSLLVREAVSDLRLIAEPLRSEVIEQLKLLRRFPKIGSAVPSEFMCVRAYHGRRYSHLLSPPTRGVEVIFIWHGKRRVPGLDKN